MPAYLDEKYLSKDIRQYNDGRVRCRVSSTNGLEVFLEGWISFDVQEDRPFSDKICGPDGFAFRSVAKPEERT